MAKHSALLECCETLSLIACEIVLCGLFWVVVVGMIWMAWEIVR